jgi:hypothetical protein
MTEYSVSRQPRLGRLGHPSRTDWATPPSGIGSTPQNRLGQPSRADWANPPKEGSGLRKEKVVSQRLCLARRLSRSGGCLRPHDGSRPSRPRSRKPFIAISTIFRTQSKDEGIHAEESIRRAGHSSAPMRGPTTAIGPAQTLLRGVFHTHSSTPGSKTPPRHPIRSPEADSPPADFACKAPPSGVKNRV